MKMPNFLDYLFGLLISTLVFFIVLAVILFGVESNVNSDIKHKASKFVNESCVSGKIDADGFLDFTRSIHKYGNYDIEISVDKVRAYPATDQNGNKRIRTGEDTYSTDQIMDAMYPKSYKKDGQWVNPQYQDYTLNAGDSITVTVVRKRSITSGVYRVFFNGSNANTVITRYNNVVGYSYGM